MEQLQKMFSVMKGTHKIIGFGSQGALLVLKGLIPPCQFEHGVQPGVCHRGHLYYLTKIDL